MSEAVPSGREVLAEAYAYAMWGIHKECGTNMGRLMRFTAVVARALMIERARTKRLREKLEAIELHLQEIGRSDNFSEHEQGEEALAQQILEDYFG